MALDVQQAKFDFVRLPNRDMLRVDEVAAYLRYERTEIYRMITSGDLEGFRQSGERSSIRITRRSVITWMARRATLDPSDFTPALIEAVLRLPREERLRVSAAIQHSL